jgi:hypothetical protein
MRAEGSLRLILNMPVFANIKIEKAGDKVVKFLGPSTEKEGAMVIYSLRVCKRK